MDITVKCPNCFQQVSKENRFCIFCGYDLSRVSDTAASTDTVPVIPEPPVTSSTPYDGPQYCPRGHDVPDPSLGFCSICGSPLVETPSPGESAIEEKGSTSKAAYVPTSPRINRKCKECGYDCDDPDLIYCPSCGVPLDNEAIEGTPDPGWLCACGNTNPSEMGFCSSCGKPKGWRPTEHKTEPKHEPVHIPKGMKPPTDSDLAPKATYEP